MIRTPLENITEAELQALISGSVPEGKTIEYKQELPGNADADCPDHCGIDIHWC